MGLRREFLSACRKGLRFFFLRITTTSGFSYFLFLLLLWLQSQISFDFSVIFQIPDGTLFLIDFTLPNKCLVVEVPILCQVWGLIVIFVSFFSRHLHDSGVSPPLSLSLSLSLSLFLYLSRCHSLFFWFHPIGLKSFNSIFKQWTH